MGIFDDAWKMAALKKQCRYCNEPAVKWKGGKYYCANCYEDIIVQGHTRQEFSAPPYMKGGGSENSEQKRKRKDRKIKIDKYRMVK